MPTTPEPLEVANMLAFEQKLAGAPPSAREGKIRAVFGVSPARYYQALHIAIDTEEALQIDAGLTHRLIRIRDSRTRTRASRDFRHH